ncbi:uncharacterized protein LY89DRAFT_183436 [Mollisia scopiformis]|uniref:2EXR domain-containing protein n=1 Tax=Mollisia scopiformis TaxID=149040 RepID=A0A194XTW2_MOLSC|nr:uncharacterized protein LY89DRAFT_183436 [Mollisia scopiformis]KUJ23474.1 hypothetical protein LY89DRAFT_183436 [Mollisia scopiformis]
MATFESFPRLPVELRLKIFALAIEPRTVNIEWSRRLRQCISSDVPTILHVSREARREGLKTYQPSFNTSLESRAPLYFSFELDTASFQWATFGRKPVRHIKQVEDDCKKLKYMVIDSSFRLNQGLELIKFENLRELQISGCTEQLPEGLEQIKLFEWAFEPLSGNRSPESKVRSRNVPLLTCLDQGDRCRNHWWFSDWNERCHMRETPLGEVSYWQLTFSVINDMANGCLQDRERRMSDTSVASSVK